MILALGRFLFQYAADLVPRSDFFPLRNLVPAFLRGMRAAMNERTGPEALKARPDLPLGGRFFLAAVRKEQPCVRMEGRSV